MTDSSRYERPGVIVTVEVAAAEADEWAGLLREWWGREPVQFARPHQPVAWIEAHFDDEVEAMLARAALRRPGVRSVSLRPAIPADWQAVYQKQFTSRPIGRRLRICPEWERAIVPEDDRVNLWIDPGLSFGTGEHFTTTFCLEMLDEVWLNSPPQSFLDAGTGSGLLAIAAAALGCERVVAFDADEDVLPYTRANLERNGVGGRVDLRHLDVCEAFFPERFDVTCANLYGGLLMESAGTLAAATERTLIVSGIRDSELEAVADAFARAGAHEAVRDSEGEWAGLRFDMRRTEK